MNTKYLVGAIAFSILLIGCTATPIRDDSRVHKSIGIAGEGAPRLPANGESYLSDAWFAEPLTVNRAVQAALLNNPQVRVELSRLDIAQAELIQAGLISNPMLDLMLLRENDGERFELDYALIQSLFDLFARASRINVADAAQARVQAEVVLSVVRIAQDTEAAYFAAISASEMLHLQQQQLALEQNMLNLQSHQAKQGVLSSSKVLAQQTNISLLAHDLQAAEDKHTQSLATLAKLLGLQSSKVLRLPDHLAPTQFAVLNEPELQALAQKHRPEFSIADAELKQIRAEKILQSGFMLAAEPSLGIAGMRDVDGMKLNGLVAKITLPIFDTGRARTQLAEAKIAQAQYQAEVVRRLIPLEVERALASLIINTKAVEHADNHVKQQQQLESLALRNYQQGNGNYTLVLDARRMGLVAQIQQIQVQQMQWTSLLELARVTGVAMFQNQ